MSYTKLWVHAVWATKNRIPLLHDRIRHKVFNHIRQNAREKNIFIDQINGYTDHIHCLISLKPDQTIGKSIQLIKGESSFWINKNQITNLKFQWQREYYAVSIDENNLHRIKNYIINQEKHHKKNTFKQEFLDFIKDYNIEIDKNYPPP